MNTQRIRLTAKHVRMYAPLHRVGDVCELRNIRLHAVGRWIADLCDPQSGRVIARSVDVSNFGVKP
jgi:hypothetical protein